jgi:hypothetical protein
VPRLLKKAHLPRWPARALRCGVPGAPSLGPPRAASHLVLSSLGKIGFSATCWSRGAESLRSLSFLLPPFDETTQALLERYGSLEAQDLLGPTHVG